MCRRTEEDIGPTVGLRHHIHFLCSLTRAYKHRHGARSGCESKFNVTRYKQKRESTEGCSKCIVRKNNGKFWKKNWFQQIEHMQVPYWTGPGVRRSKGPLLVCHTHRYCSMETSQNSVKVEVIYKVTVWYKNDIVWKVLSYEINMQSLNALPLLVQKLWQNLKFWRTIRSTFTVTRWKSMIICERSNHHYYTCET